MKPKVILLAAGKSTRTWPIEEKIFFQFFGKTVLEHQIQTMIDTGLTDFCVVGNNENILRIKDICRNIPSAVFTFSIQENLKEGQRGGILSAKKYIPNKEAVLIVCSNDMVDKKAFTNLLEKTNTSDSEIFLVGKKVDKYFPGGYLKTTEKNIITEIVEKPKPGTEPSNLVTLLIHYYKNPFSLFQKLQNQKEGDGYEDVLQSLFDENIKAEAIPYNGFWQGIKYPWNFLDVGSFFLNSIKESYIDSSAEIGKNVSLNGKVYISKGVRIFDYSVINGPVFIGENSIIANHSLVRNSHIGENCVIGQGSEIARSIIGNSCWTHQNFVGDSVFDENVSLGAGTKTGNLRLDEKEILSTVKNEKVNSFKTKLGVMMGKNIRIGINTSIMPGVKIGSDNFIGAGTVCEKDIPENMFTFQKSRAESKVNKSEAFYR